MTQPNIDAQTFLTAVYQGNVEQLRKYLHQDATLANTCDEQGNSALHIAAHNLHVEVIRLLLSHGADVNATGHFGAKPIHAACDVREVPVPAIQKEILQLLINKGADVNAKNKNRITPLHNAVRARSIAAVEFLLENGADVDAKDSNRGSTPLRRAVTNTGAGGTAGRGDDAIVITELLLAYGADPFMKDNRGRMVIDSARNKPIIELLQKGVDTSVADMIVHR